MGIARDANQTLHLLAAGLWLGGLVPLGYLLRLGRSVEDAAGMCLIRGAIRRFSQMGYLAVALIAATGAVNTLLLVGGAAAMFSTVYGRLLAVKILLFLAMVVVALVNRFYLSPRIAGDTRAALGSLYRGVEFEQGLAICILALISVIGTLPPAILGGRN